MKITRHNYEEFFLLFVDGELSGSEKLEVEAFVADNPDLKVELDLLIESVLPPVSFPFNKKDLHKSVKEYFPSDERILPFIDGELSPSETDKFILEVDASPMLKEEVLVLMQTRLDSSEMVSFGNRSALYRREKGRVVAMRIIQIAVAAAVLLLMFTAVWVYLGIEPANNMARNNHLQQNKGSGKIVRAEANEDKFEGKIPNGSQPELITNKRNSNQFVAAESNNPAVKANRLYVNVRDRVPSNASQPFAPESIAAEKNVLPESNKITPTPVPLKENLPVYVNQAPDELMANLPKREVGENKLPVSDYNSEVIDNNVYAKTAAVKEGNDNTIFYLPEEEVAKTKVGSIFKKVKRAIIRNSNSKTANGITIGGFQIALK